MMSNMESNIVQPCVMVWEAMSGEHLYFGPNEVLHLDLKLGSRPIISLTITPQQFGGIISGIGIR